jgi:hypothetical protein
VTSPEERTVGRSSVQARESQEIGDDAKAGPLRLCPVLDCPNRTSPVEARWGTVAGLASHLFIAHGYSYAQGAWGGADYWAERAWNDPDLVIVRHPDGITEVVTDRATITDEVHDLPTSKGPPCEPGRRHVWARDLSGAESTSVCVNCGIAWEDADTVATQATGNDDLTLSGPVEVPLDLLIRVTRTDIFDEVERILDGLKSVIAAQMSKDQGAPELARDFTDHHSEGASLSCGCVLRVYEGAGESQIILRPCVDHRRAMDEVVVEWKVTK